MNKIFHAILPDFVKFAKQKKKMLFCERKRTIIRIGSGSRLANDISLNFLQECLVAYTIRKKKRIQLECVLN